MEGERVKKRGREEEAGIRPIVTNMLLCTSTYGELGSRPCTQKKISKLRMR